MDLDTFAEIVRWSFIAVWLGLIVQARRILKRNKQTGRELDEALRRASQQAIKGQQAGVMCVSDIVDATGLSELQVQVAMDAAMAQFRQRIEEMQRSTHGRRD